MLVAGESAAGRFRDVLGVTSRPVGRRQSMLDHVVQAAADLLGPAQLIGGDVDAVGDAGHLRPALFLAEGDWGVA